MSAYGFVNLGAAGTFLVRKKMTPTELRCLLQRELPICTEMAVLPVEELRQAWERARFPKEARMPGVRRFVSFLLAPATKSATKLPAKFPSAGGWQVLICAIEEPLVFSLWRKTGERLVYPNEVVEKIFGVAATTRNGETIVKLLHTESSGLDKSEH